MNDTNITPRQSLILNLINQSTGLSRQKIQKQISKTHKVSKPTLIRDLNKLIKMNFIKAKGKGKNTKYFPSNQNPLLKPFSLTQYFLKEPDKRVGALKNFNFKVFNYLSNLFLKTELKKINKVKKSFFKQTQKLNPDILRKELERFTIELSWKSSKIEGNTYTLLETEKLIKKNQEAEGKNKQEAFMILNHKNAFEAILKNPDDYKEISPFKIKQIHSLLVKNLNIATGIRKQAVGITGTVYQPLDNQFQINEAMEKLTKTINKNNNPFEKALITNAMIAYIQPFNDGNKRTARILSNAILIANDCFPLSYRSVSEDEFKKANILLYEQNSIYHLKRLFVEQLVFSYNNYFK